MTPDDLAGWLIERVIPYWMNCGRTSGGGFLEQLDRQSHCAPATVRLRVIARQTYVCSLAERLGISGVRSAFVSGLSKLTSIIERPPHLGRVSYDQTTGRPIDPQIDLYDNAFVLLALSEVGKQEEFKQACAILAARLLDAILTLRHPGEGFQEGVPPSLPRRQNPHMHLFEAVIEAASTFRDPRYIALADELADLAVTRFFQNQCYLEENFTELLEPSNPLAAHIEPGHHYEWASLIDLYLAMPGSADSKRRNRLLQFRDRLLDFADDYGLTPDKALVHNVVDQQGRVLDATFRIWTSLEKLRHERWSGKDTARSMTGLSYFVSLADPHWVERLSSDRQPVTLPCPGTTLYHLINGILQPAPMENDGRVRHVAP